MVLSLNPKKLVLMPSLAGDVTELRVAGTVTEPGGGAVTEPKEAGTYAELYGVDPSLRISSFLDGRSS